MKKPFYLFIAIPIATISFTGCNTNEMKIKAIDEANMDLTVKPSEDFNRYANGGWMKNNPIPGDKSRFGTFDQLRDMAEKQVFHIVDSVANTTNAQGTIAQKIGDFYNSGMDTAKIDQQGLEPVLEYFKNIENIQNTDDCRNAIAQLHSMEIPCLFSVSGAADVKNSTWVLTNISQDGLSLPEKEYYFADDEITKNIREQFKVYVEKMFVLKGNQADLARQKAEGILKFETRLAGVSMSVMDLRDPHATDHKMTLADLEKMEPVFGWVKYLASIGLKNVIELNVQQPLFFEEMGKMLKTVPLNDWKVYIEWHLLNNIASYVGTDFENQSFEFYGKVLSGKTEMSPRWKRVVATTNASLAEPLGQLYVSAYFPPEAKSRMIDLVKNLKSALAVRIENLDWMSQETKQKALDKLQTMKYKIGYPDTWRDYTGLEIANDAYVLNVLRAGKFDFQYQLSKIDKNVEEGEWLMPPQMVNAYFAPDKNEIVFPAAILQPPFFYLNADDAVNYGAIGMVIGHEMTHGFDDQGRLYDKHGNLSDWWTEDDSRKFMERSKVLVDQFNRFVVLDTVHANGELTLGENIADLGGLNIAFTAYKIANPEFNEKIDGFSPEQRFFLAYAHLWAQNTRDQEKLRRTREDVHSLGQFRVNGPLPNIAEFHDAFGIKEGEPMYLPLNERANIW